MWILQVIKTGNSWEQVQVKGSAIAGMQHNLDPLAKSEESAVPTKCIFRIKKVGSNWSTHGSLLLVTVSHLNPQLWWKLAAYRWQKLWMLFEVTSSKCCAWKMLKHGRDSAYGWSEKLCESVTGETSLYLCNHSSSSNLTNCFIFCIYPLHNAVDNDKP